MCVKFITTIFVLLIFNLVHAHSYIPSCQADKESMNQEALETATINPKKAPQFIGISNLSTKSNQCFADGEMVNAHSCTVVWIKNHWKETMHCIKGSYRE